MLARRWIQGSANRHASSLLEHGTQTNDYSRGRHLKVVRLEHGEAEQSIWMAMLVHAKGLRDRANQDTNAMRGQGVGKRYFIVLRY